MTGKKPKTYDITVVDGKELHMKGCVYCPYMRNGRCQEAFTDKARECLLFDHSLAGAEPVRLSAFYAKRNG